MFFVEEGLQQNILNNTEGNKTVASVLAAYERPVSGTGRNAAHPNQRRGVVRQGCD